MSLQELEPAEPARPCTVPPPLHHAAFGNGRVIALVSPTSAIEWLCLPRFDSPSVFARILDAERGGSFRILHGTGERIGKLGYIPNTNVVACRFEVDGASWEVVDFAPRIPEGLSVRVPVEIVRIVRPLSGQPKLHIDFDPRPDYAREAPQILEAHDSIEVRGGGAPLFLSTNLPLPYVLNRRDFALTQPAYFVLSYGRPSELRDFATVARELDLTVAGWRAWTKSCALPTFAADAVLRSALCLKLHASHDTGAIIAATTTSIPEAMHTQRTWDYRYCWLRDAAFVVEALRRLSHVNEGEALLRFLRDIVEGGPIQPVYGIGGETALGEIMLPHLAGFGGNGFVRVGNAASEQRQNDLFGELVLCLESLLCDPRIVHDDPSSYYPLIKRLVEAAIEAAPQPDTSIWEFRTSLRNYTFSYAMCWVAVQRGSMLATRFGDTQSASAWSTIADRMRQTFLERAYNPELGFFTQQLNGEHPDASNLLLPTLGIVDAHDPRFTSTLRAYEERLVEGGLMMRYRNLDDFGQTTSTFTICSFWWAEALALTGRLNDAVTVFQRVLRFANSVGLFSEDVDPPTGALLGNFPQAYTHVGLIHAATTIGELLEARDGRVRAWT